MCFFLTVAVPAKHVERIGEVFARGFETHATQNPSLSAALPIGYEARLVTSGMCSCGLYARARLTAESDHTARLRTKYGKLGWTEAKIQRSLEQNVASTSKRHQPTAGLRGDVTDRLDTLCRAAGSVAFLVHWYNGDVESERLPLHRAEPCLCDQIPKRAKELREDEVIVAAIRRAD